MGKCNLAILDGGGGRHACFHGNKWETELLAAGNREIHFSKAAVHINEYLNLYPHCCQSMVNLKSVDLHC